MVDFLCCEAVKVTRSFTSRGCGFELHWRHSVVSLSKTLYPQLSTGSTQKEPIPTWLKIVNWDVKNQIKQTNKNFISLLGLNVSQWTL